MVVVNRDPDQDKYVNATDPGLVLSLDDISVYESNSTKVMLSNCHRKNLTVLFMVRNYTSLGESMGPLSFPNSDLSSVFSSFIWPN